MDNQLEKFSIIKWTEDSTPEDLRKVLLTLSKIGTASRDLRLNIIKHIYEKQS